MSDERTVVSIGSCLKSERFVVGVQLGDTVRKLFQIQFHGDGSVFVHFPYFHDAEGIATVATVPPGRGESQVDLTKGGRVTSHRVKYSHHPDGTVHFSQDKKVITMIRKRSVPLHESKGHLFTAHMTGPQAFKAASARDEKDVVPNPKRTLLRCTFPEGTRRFKFAGWFYSAANFVRMTGKEIAPKIVLQQPDGSIADAFVCAAPTAQPGDDRILVLSVQEWDIASDGNAPSLLFLGGFDTPEVAEDLSKETQVLALKYPIASGDNLRDRLGTMDYTP